MLTSLALVVGGLLGGVVLTLGGAVLTAYRLVGVPELPEPVYDQAVVETELPAIPPKPTAPVQIFRVTPAPQKGTGSSSPRRSEPSTGSLSSLKPARSSLSTSSRSLGVE